MGVFPHKTEKDNLVITIFIKFCYINIFDFDIYQNELMKISHLRTIISIRIHSTQIIC